MSYPPIKIVMGFVSTGFNAKDLAIWIISESYLASFLVGAMEYHLWEDVAMGEIAGSDSPVLSNHVYSIPHRVGHL
tara:strand:- start:127 stop:354 length:228 start_codon:yes stop_codon:yes gene_type:complete